MAYWKLILRSVCCLMIFVKVGGYVYVENESNNIADRKSDDAFLTAARCYRIRNRRSGLFMTVVGVNVHQHPLKTGEDRDGQVWFVTPLEKGNYYITNKRTGLSLYEQHNDSKHYGPSWLGALTFKPNVAEKWVIEIAPVAAGGRFYTIKNKLTQWFLLIGGYLTTAGGVVHHWPLDKTKHIDSQQWSIEIEQEFPALLEANRIVNRSVSDIGHIQSMSSSQQPIPSKTEEVLIGQLAIPFSLIVDPIFTEAQQSTLSPFYLLRRYGYWQVVTYHDHSGSTHVTMTVNVTLGLITSNDKAIEEITGLGVTAESSLCLTASRLTAMIAEIANGLKINVDEGSTGASSKQMQLERNYISLSKQNHVVWFREDRYVLERMNGVKVLDWITRVPASISDGFRSNIPQSMLGRPAGTYTPN